MFNTIDATTPDGPGPDAAQHTELEPLSIRQRLNELQVLEADPDAARAIRSSREVNLTKMAVALCDSAAFLLATVSAHLVAGGSPGNAIGPVSSQLVMMVLAVPALLAAMASRRLYQARFIARRSDELRRLVDALALTVVSMTTVGFLLKTDVSRTWILLTLVFAIPSVFVEREVLRRFFRRRRTDGRSTRRVIVVGQNGEAGAVVDMLNTDRSLGYEVLGVVSPAPDTDQSDPTLDLVARVIEGVRTTGATGVVITATSLDLNSSNRLIRVLTHAGLHVELTSALSDVETRRISIRALGRYPVLYVEPVPGFGLRPLAKRSFDVVVASAALVVLAVPMAIVAAVIACTSPGGVLFRQRRLGRGGETFEVLKFRSMVSDAESLLIDLRAHNEADGPMFKMKDDPRVTRVGKFIRRTSLDELPQLWNVLRGEMSLVGPRPALPDEAHGWSPVLFNRLRVRPGITGMWQVSGRSDANFDDYTRLDVYYVDNWSLIVDLAIIVRTIPAVLAARGAR